MKIRNGFVSNSSSSSFVYLLKKEDYAEMLESADKFQKQVLKELYPQEVNVFGMELMMVSGGSGNCSSFEYMDVSFQDDDLEDPDDEEAFYEKYGYEPYAQEAFYMLNWPKDVFHTSVDM